MPLPSKWSLVSAVLAFFSVTAAAQTSTGYFVQNSTSRHLLNPAFSPEQGYVGIPVVSNLEVSTMSNLGVGSFLFPKEGTTYTFLSSQVSADEFLSKIHPMNYLDGMLSSDIVDVGFRWKENFFWTVNVGVRAELQSSLPSELFSFVKNGMVDSRMTVCDIGHMDVSSNMYGQAALGFTARIPSVEGLSVGGKIKALFGMGGASVSLDRWSVILQSDQYVVSSSAAGYLAGRFVLLKESDRKIIDIGIDWEKATVCGYGIGIDLGIAYRISTGCALDGLMFSLSAVDIGFVNYLADDITGIKMDDAAATFTGAAFTSLKNGDFSGRVKEMMLSLTELLAFRTEVNTEDRKMRLASKIFAGIEYPFLQDKMRAGILYHCTMGTFRTSHELTASWNYSPVRQFNVALSYSFLNSRQSFGWQLSFTPREGMNIFLGSDYTSLVNSARGLPVTAGFMNFSFGLSVPIQSDYSK